MQVNTGSITGDFGEEWAEAARFMVSRRWVHLTGSNAHYVNQWPPVLSGALELIEGIAGPGAARLISRVWPREILRGRDIQAWEPLPPPDRQL